jgi:hypothetical protein
MTAHTRQPEAVRGLVERLGTGAATNRGRGPRKHFYGLLFVP